MLDKEFIIEPKKTIRWKYLTLIDYVLPVYIVFSIPLFYFDWNLDFMFKGAGIFFTLIYVIKFGVPKYKSVTWFTIFVLLVTFSFLQYLYNNRPIECYFSDVSNYVAAMLFFYIGVSDDRPGRSFYVKLMYAITIVFAIGILCYLTTPSWYLSRSLELLNKRAAVDYGENDLLNQLRFCAFFRDSYSVSHLSVFCSAIAIWGVVYGKGKEKILAIFCMSIGCVSSIMSMHRASILGCVITIGLYVYFNYRTHHYRDNIKLFYIATLIMLTFLISNPDLGERLGDVIGMVTNRVDDNMSLSTALSERKFTHEVMSSMQFFLFGHGLGAGGVGVRKYGFPGISDMQYVKMFYENGIIGAVLFIGIINRAIIRGFKKIKLYMTEIAIILFILLAMLGSNSLSIYYMIVYPFWYAIGKTCNINVNKSPK